jgi:hypothetical protein
MPSSSTNHELCHPPLNGLEAGVGSNAILECKPLSKREITVLLLRAELVAREGWLQEREKSTVLLLRAELVAREGWLQGREKSTVLLRACVRVILLRCVRMLQLLRVCVRRLALLHARVLEPEHAHVPVHVLSCSVHALVRHAADEPSAWALELAPLVFGRKLQC